MAFAGFAVAALAQAETYRNPVTVIPRTHVILPVGIKLSPPNPHVGDSVTFTAHYPGDTQAAFYYRFSFDRGRTWTLWSATPSTTKRFDLQGPESVSAESSDRNLAQYQDGATSNTATGSQSFTVLPVPTLAPHTIGLEPSRVQATAWVPVEFRVVLSYPVDLAAFTFNAGDNSGSVTPHSTTFSHVYRAAGHYTAAVALGRAVGTGSAISEVDVAALAGRLRIAAQPREIGVDVPMSIDPLPAPIRGARYRFYFGDKGDSGWLAQPSTTHAYVAPGGYAVHAEVGSLGEGPVQTVAQSNTVGVLVTPHPGIALSPEPARTYPGIPVTFRVRTDNAGQAPSLDFDPGDQTKRVGTRATEIPHAYAAPGTYDAVVSLEGHVPAVAARATVAVLPLPPARLDMRPADAEVGRELMFSVDFPADIPDLRYRFYFDGKAAPSAWSVPREATRAYAAPGNYSVRAEVGVRVANAVRVVASTDVRPVQVPMPHVTITPQTPWMFTGRPVAFTVSSAGTGPSPRYDFDPGDGSPVVAGPGPAFAHTYTKSGAYAVVATLLAPKYDAKAATTVRVVWLPPTIVVVGSLLSAGVLSVLAYLKLGILLPRLVSFHPRPSERVKIERDGSGPSASVSMHFYPNLAAVQSRMADGPKKIVKKKVKTDAPATDKPA